MPYSQKPANSNIRLLFTTVLAGGLFYGIDTLWRGSALTPVLSICWIMAASIRCSKKVTLQSSLILLVFVILSLSEGPLDRIIIRTSSFIIGSSIAYLYARSREHTIQLVNQLRQIIAHVPAAIITADGMGCILSSSNELRNLIGNDDQKIDGQSFSDILMGNMPPGEAMRRYLEMFNRDGVHDEQFCLRNHSEQRFRGRVTCTGQGRYRLLIASLHKS